MREYDSPKRRSKTTLYGLGLADIFVVDDPRAFSPRTAVYNVAATTLADLGLPVPSNQEVYAFLRREVGIREVTRRGVRGFLGITTVPDLHAQPRLVPTGTASARKHRGDDSDQARAAEVAQRLRRSPTMRPESVRRLLREYPHKFY